MAMASLTAALINRQPARPVDRVAGEVLLLPAKPKTVTAPTTAPKPAARTAPAREPRTHAPHRTPTAKPARQRKTLRLMRETHRALRTLAAARGVSQQSLMETAVEKLLAEETDTPPRH